MKMGLLSKHLQHSPSYLYARLFAGTSQHACLTETKWCGLAKHVHFFKAIWVSSRICCYCNTSCYLSILQLGLGTRLTGISSFCCLLFSVLSFKISCYLALHSKPLHPQTYFKELGGNHWSLLVISDFPITRITGAPNSAVTTSLCVCVCVHFQACMFKTSSCPGLNLHQTWVSSSFHWRCKWRLLMAALKRSGSKRMWASQCGTKPSANGPRGAVTPNWATCPWQF